MTKAPDNPITFADIEETIYDCELEQSTTASGEQISLEEGESANRALEEGRVCVCCYICRGSVPLKTAGSLGWGLVEYEVEEDGEIYRGARPVCPACARAS